MPWNNLHSLLLASRLLTSSQAVPHRHPCLTAGGLWFCLCPDARLPTWGLWLHLRCLQLRPCPALLCSAPRPLDPSPSFWHPAPTQYSLGFLDFVIPCSHAPENKTKIFDQLMHTCPDYSNCWQAGQSYWWLDKTKINLNHCSSPFFFSLGAVTETTTMSCSPDEVCFFLLRPCRDASGHITVYTTKDVWLCVQTTSASGFSDGSPKMHVKARCERGHMVTSCTTLSWGMRGNTSVEWLFYISLIFFLLHFIHNIWIHGSVYLCVCIYTLSEHSTYMQFRVIFFTTIWSGGKWQI